MKKSILTSIFILILHLGFSQTMTNERMGKIFESVADSIQGSNGQWQFKIKDTYFVAITDANHNRMRIISPITEAKRLTEDLKSAALVANFHTALDVKYAIADDLLWSVFIHPLKELTEAQVRDAVKQVYGANITFGTTFSSTDLIFPGSQGDKKKEEKKKKGEKILRREY